MIKIMACILILAALIPSYLHSGEYPVDQGGFMLSGNVNINTALGDANSRSISDRLHFSPGLTYFATHNLGVGIRAVFEKLKYYGDDLHALAIGPEISYYFGGAKSGGYPFISADFQYLDYDFGTQYTDYSGSGFQIGFGLGYMDLITQHAALTGAFEYFIQHIPTDRFAFGDSGHAFYVGIGLSYFIF
jgi:hypothetical protein